jgi:hypothetical protein
MAIGIMFPSDKVLADPFDVFVEELALDVPTGGDVDLVGWVSLSVADGPAGSCFGFIERGGFVDVVDAGTLSFVEDAEALPLGGGHDVGDVAVDHVW